MSHGRGFLSQLPAFSELPGEPLPGQSVVELLGEHRVLVEKHLGVRQYSRQCVCVGMRYGCVCVQGQSLELLHMSKEQLVIAGEIETISINRKGSV